MTSLREIARHTGFEINAVSGRVNELKKDDLIKEIKPDIIVKGGDYRPSEVVGCDIAEIKIFNYIDGYSTTSVLEKQNDLRI